MNHVDVDQRHVLLANVVVTGGSSLLYHFTDRINFELQNLYPAPRIRLIAPGNIVERKYAAWIGGSILASLGSFHQLWISKKEYEEHGPGIVEKRCK
jgi:actin-related protein 4